MEQEKEFYTIKEAAEVLGVSTKTIRNYMDREGWKRFKMFGDRSLLIPAKYIEQAKKPQAVAA